MKAHPTLFNAAMVRAISAGMKTQTRRLLEPRGLGFIGCCCGGSAARWVAEGDRWHCGTCGGGARLTAKDVEYLRCPYGQPGDRLWVREAWKAHSTFDHLPPRDLPQSHIWYLADSGYKAESRTRASMHMPRWASRITLEITGVRVERLQEISETDAIAEGIEKTAHGLWSLYGQADVDGTYSPRASFRALWQSINGPESWEANPWLWVVEFKRLEAGQ